MPEGGGAAEARRLFPCTAGLLRPGRVRRILQAAGYSLHLGLPGPGDQVAVWGRTGYAWRGEKLARWRDVPLLRLEDAFLRSVYPGRSPQDDGPLGLLLDPGGVHYDAGAPSHLESLLAAHPLDDPVLLARATEGIARLRALDLSKYNTFDERLAAPEPGYVLVIDQTASDAAIRYGGASAATFAAMLAAARRDHPGEKLLIKTHPEVLAGLRRGHFGAADLDANTRLCTLPLSPWKLLEGARAVYTVSSLMGYEAILAGHVPHVFGLPFYAGWGLSLDAQPVPARRHRRLSAVQAFAASHILAPLWYDPCRDRPCSFEEALDQLEAEVHAYRQDRGGFVASGMRLWKRGALQQVFGRQTALRFCDPPARAADLAARTGRSLLIWAGRETASLAAAAPATDGGAATGSRMPSTHRAALPRDARPATIWRVEDGFLRSRGLGAALVAPLSLVLDRQGIYYDPTRPSDLEELIAAPLPPGGQARAARLIATVRAGRLSKYNLANHPPPRNADQGGIPAAEGSGLAGLLAGLPAGRRILVPGQVEDDASLRLGAGDIRSNLALLARVRAENPQAVILYKPHPDVEAGLRPGRIPPAEARLHADLLAEHADPIALIEAVDEVWTMTSLLGFEALLRGKPVTVTGAPFYAGWGLTRDLGQTPARRQTARPDLLALAHAALISYPRYHDPVSGRPCPPEVVAERLVSATLPRPAALNRLLAKAQGALAGQAWIWRR